MAGFWGSWAAFLYVQGHGILSASHKPKVSTFQRCLPAGESCQLSAPPRKVTPLWKRGWRLLRQAGSPSLPADEALEDRAPVILQQWLPPASG